VRIASSLRKSSLAILVTAGLAVSLAACSAPAPDTTDSGDCTPAPSGSASDSVKVTGDFGKLPIVIFDPGLTAKSTERTVVIDGDGETVQAGDTVQVQFSILNGGTAVNIDGTGYTDDTLVDFDVDEKKLLPGLVKTLECSTVGSRVVGVIPPADAFGDAGSEQLSIGATDDIVFVVDVVAIKQPLTPKAWTKDVPEVTFAADGTPTVKLPATDPPKDLMEAVLTEGDGAVVKSGQSVTIKYHGTSWDTGEVFDQSFDRDDPPFPVDNFVPGFTAALIGQKVGSTVIVVIPPEDAYGTDPEAHELGGQTLVFLVKIIAAS